MVKDLPNFVNDMLKAFLAVIILLPIDTFVLNE
jgi:hypothetical protein